MTDELLREIVQEIKGLRQEAVSTNRRLDGLKESVIVLQQGVSEVRYELRNIKEIL